MSRNIASKVVVSFFHRDITKICNCIYIYGDWISAKLKVNIKLYKFNKLFGFEENCVDYKFLNNLMLVARFFIYRSKYSKSKPNMLEYFNELNMIHNLSEYILAKRNKNLAEH